MKKINIFNTLRHFLNVFMLLLLLVGVNTTAWGKIWTWQITVGVSEGKGTVYADIDYEFFGWHDEKNSEDATYGNSKEVTVTTDHKWASSNSNRRGHVYVKSADPGYSFLAWYDENGNQLSTSETYEAFGKCNDGAIRKCYAIFTPNKYTVVLKPNKGTGGDQIIYPTYDAGMPGTLKNGGAIVAPTRANYVFEGYYDAAEGGTKYYHADLTSAHVWDKAADNVSLYAHWVDKRTPSVTCTKTTLLVEEELASAFTFVNTDGISWEIINTNVNSPINNGDGQVIAYNEGQNKVIAHNAGTATIRFTQSETSTTKGSVFEFNFTVSKRSNSISCSWGSWSKNLNFDQGEYVSFPTSNTNYTATPVIVSQTSGTANATYYPDQGAIYASHNIGSATWSVYQPEDYKYVATDTDTLTVNIGTISTECYVFGPTGEESWGTYGEVTYDFSEKGTKVYYDVKRTAIAGFSDNIAWHVLYSVDGEHWTSHDIEVDDRDKWYTQSIDIPEDVRHVKFESVFGAAGNHFVSNVRVVRKEWFNIEDKNGTTISSDVAMPTNTLGGNKTTEKIIINYSTCADSIKLVSSHSHITFGDTDTTTYQFASDGSGKQEITLTYASNSVESIEGDVTIYTPYEHRTIHITASTEKKTQTIEWHAPFNVAQVTLPVTFQSQNITPAPATATSGLSIKYSVQAGEESIIRIENGGTSFTVIGIGTAHLTATQAGNGTWKPVSDTKVIVTSNKLIQRILWDQVFTRGMAVDSEIPLSAIVHVENIATATDDESPERTSLIQYTSGNNSVAGVILRDGVYYLHVNGYGTTTITAAVPGDEEYESATVTKDVVVKEIVAGDCEAPLVFYQPEEIEFFSWLSLTSEMKSYQIAIDRTKGIPDKLSFDVRGVAKKVAIEYYRGGINVQESTDNCVSWSGNLNASMISPAKGTTINSGQLQLSPNATHIRFVRPEGAAGYHYMGNIQVTMLPTLEAPAEIDFGNIACGEIRKKTEVPLTYSYLKGSFSITKEADPNDVLDVESYVERECGDFGSYDLPIHITPDTVGPWENTITITDGSKTKEVKLKATFTPGSQDITWEHELDITMTTPPALDAVASSGLEVQYTITAGNDVASIVGNEVVISKPGTFTIRVTQPGNGNYTAAEPVEKTFTVKRAQFVFNGSGTEEDDPKHVTWCYEDNWKENQRPGSEDEVLIAHNVVIRQEVSVYSVTINEGDTLTIMPTGGLTVGAGGIIGATTGNLILKAGTAEDGDLKGQTGYLRISPEYTGAMPQATVELYSKAYYNLESDEENIAAWQYVGSPLVGGEKAKPIFIRSWIYNWNEATGLWENNRKNLVLRPFVGYSTTQYQETSGMKISFAGTLVSNQTDIDIPLTYTKKSDYAGCNVIANSFTAPIDITKLEDSDFRHADTVIYLYNTGSRQDATKKDASINAPGQYIHIPVGSSRDIKAAFPEYPTVIAPMQGFCVHAIGENAKLRLDYRKHVWRGTESNTPLRVKKQEESELMGALCISLFADGWHDNLYMLESEKYNTAFENGYDARKRMSGSLNVFAVEDDAQLAVDATNSIIGTHVGVRTGSETAYTFVFSHLQSENGLALYDAETEQTIDIDENTEYTFFAAPETEITGRFRIVARADAPAITTGVDGVENEAKAVKFIKDDQIYILKNGVLYNAMGAIVR